MTRPWQHEDRNPNFGSGATNYCVEASTRDAGERDYDVILWDDGSAGFTEERDQIAFEVLNETYAKVKSTDDLPGQIERLAKKPYRLPYRHRSDAGVGTGRQQAFV